jgi:hypothetical protein
MALSQVVTERYRRFGAFIVDATRPLHEVADEALAAGSKQ